MNQEVKDILIKGGWSEEYIDKFLPALKEIAEAYDKSTGSFPESEWEGKEFFAFCADKMPSTWVGLQRLAKGIQP